MIVLHKEYTRRFNTEYMILDKPNDMIKFTLYRDLVKQFINIMRSL